jgi:hypothetical protein
VKTAEDDTDLTASQRASLGDRRSSKLRVYRMWNANLGSCGGCKARAGHKKIVPRDVAHLLRGSA